MSSFSQPSSFPIAYQAHYTIKQSSPSTWRLPIHPSLSHTRKPNPVITCQKFYFSQVLSHPCLPYFTHWPHSGPYDFPTLLLENLSHGQLLPSFCFLQPISYSVATLIFLKQNANPFRQLPPNLQYLMR